jgi:CheY-like chemotaxis protein
MRRPKILIVDDDAEFSGYVKLGLERTSAYEVRVVLEPESTIAAARAFMPDVILLDIMMPRMDGTMVAAALAKEPELKNIPIVFVTAILSRSDPRILLPSKTGPFYLAKPSEISEIERCIKSVIGKP